MIHHLETIARETGIALSSVASTAKLLAEGGTVPFISRYRKEQTGSLDEVQFTTIRDRMLQLAELAGDAAMAGRYRDAARRTLATLCQRFLAVDDPHWEGILKGGVYHLHKGLGVNESVMWGEYFFVEALDRALANA